MALEWQCHSSDNVDEGLQETEDQLRAPAIVLKHHDSRLPFIVDGGQNLIARILLWPIKAFSQLSVILPTSCKVVKIQELTLTRNEVSSCQARTFLKSGNQGMKAVSF